jgi:hypothetical protein
LQGCICNKGVFLLGLFFQHHCAEFWRPFNLPGIWG